MPAQLALPPQLDRYRILGQIGFGGMGAVYLAEDTLLSRKVALKIPHAAPQGSPVLERFLREARTAASIEHPNLCPLHDVGEFEGIHYLVMPLIEGVPLSRIIGEGGAWDLVRALSLVKKLAVALQVLHERNLIHRDLKPANVMIRPNGEPVIMDFGLVKPVVHDSRHLTQLGSLIGTPAYMPPEQIHGDAPLLGPTADVYALGVILYELLTGTRPFEGPTLQIIFAQILHVVPDAPSFRRPELPAWINAVCLKALEKVPSERYLSMMAFAQALVAPPPLAATFYTTVPRALETLPREAIETQQAPSLPAPSLAHASIVCPTCTKVLKVPIGLEDKKLICPRCQMLLRNPTPIARDVISPMLGSDESVFTAASKTPWGVLLASAFVLVLCSFLGWRILTPKGEKEVQTNENTTGENPTLTPRASLRLLPLAEIETEQGQTAKLAVRVVRDHCKGPVELRMMGLPNGIEPGPGVISATSDQGTVEFRVSAETTPAALTFRLLAIAGDTEAEGSVRLNVRPAKPVAPPPLPTLKLSPLDDVEVMPGKSVTVNVQVAREHCKGPIELRLEGLPNDLTAGAGLIPADTDRGSLQVKASAVANLQTVMIRLIALSADTRVEGGVRLIVKTAASVTVVPPDMPPFAVYRGRVVRIVGNTITLRPLAGRGVLPTEKAFVLAADARFFSLKGLKKGEKPVESEIPNGIKNEVFIIGETGGPSVSVSTIREGDMEIVKTVKVYLSLPPKLNK